MGNLGGVFTCVSTIFPGKYQLSGKAIRMWYVLRQVKIFMGYSASRIYCVIGANEYTIDMGRLGALHWYFAQNSMSFLGLDSLSRMVGAASESLRVA